MRKQDYIDEFDDGSVLTEYDPMSNGIDRLKLTLEVQDMTIDAEMLGDKLTYSDDGGIILNNIDGSKVSVSDIDINIGAIQVCFTSSGKKRISIGINPAKMLYGLNENNTKAKYIPLIKTLIRKELAGVGVFVNPDHMKVCSIELNCNMDNPKLYGFFKALQVSSSELSEKIMQTINRHKIQSSKLVSKSDDGLAIKIYKKSEHLKEHGHHDLIHYHNLVRLELTITHHATLCRLLGKERTLDGLLMNWDKINNFFINTINTRVFIPVLDVVDLLENECVIRLSNGDKPKSIVESFAYDEMLIDYNIFFNAMRKFYRQVGNKNLNRDIKSLEKHLKRIKTRVFKYEDRVGVVDAIREFQEQILSQKSL